MLRVVSDNGVSRVTPEELKFLISFLFAHLHGDTDAKIQIEALSNGGGIRFTSSVIFDHYDMCSTYLSHINTLEKNKFGSDSEVITLDYCNDLVTENEHLGLNIKPNEENNSLISYNYLMLFAKLPLNSNFAFVVTHDEPDELEELSDVLNYCLTHRVSDYSQDKITLTASAYFLLQ